MHPLEFQAESFQKETMGICKFVKVYFVIYKLRMGCVITYQETPLALKICIDTFY